jgi:SAM-dependent methyltransferase
MTSSSERDLGRIRSLYRSREREGEFWDFRTFNTLEPQIYFTESLFRDHLFDILRRDGYDFHRADEAKVLEIGCGWGRNLYAFLEAGFRTSHLSGVDLMSHFIERARIANPALQVQVGNGAETGFASGGFDIVLCHTVLSAILDAELHRAVIAEALRVLRPGGLFIVFDIRPGYPEGRARTADGGEAVFIRSVPPDDVVAFAADRATRVYFRTMGLSGTLRAATFYGWWRAVLRKLRLARARPPAPRAYTARAFLARTLGAVPSFRTHYILALKRNER